MKKFYSLLVALLTLISVNANAADVVKAGEKYMIASSGSVDIEFDTEEVVPDGKNVVVFYYTSDPSHPFLFGKNYKDCKYKNEDGFVRMWCALAHNKNANGTEHLNIYGNVAEGEYWCYTICDASEVETVASPLAGSSEGSGSAEKPETVVLEKNGTVSPSTIYAIPVSGEAGYVADNLATLSTAVAEGQTIVVFLNAPKVAGAADFTNIFYTANDKNYKALGLVEDSKDGTFSFRRYTYNGPQAKIDIYAEDMNKQGSGYTWTYVIVNSEAEAATVANPADVAGSTPTQPTVVPGQDIENAIVLTNGVSADFKSFNNGSEVVYFKFVAEDFGTVKVNLGAESSRARWMEDGVMAYGQLRQNMLKNGNELTVEKEHTYYLVYNFAEATESTISYTLEADEQGAVRANAIVIATNGTQDLLGIARVGDDYFNKVTWFKLDKAALSDKKLVSVALDGGNQTEVALYINEESDPIKTYAMGSGSGMLATNSTVQFDIDLTANDYYIAINQDDVNGKATFTFHDVVPGQSIGSAIAATLGDNTSVAGNWYKYTHTGDNMIVVTNTNLVVDANEGNVASGEDILDGFRMQDGETIYFKANSGSFKVESKEIETGLIAEKPIVITVDEEGLGMFSFNLKGSASDTYRYMEFTAPSDGSFMYGTTNAKVIQTAFSASVKDITDPEKPKAMTIVQREEDFGEAMFVYSWNVVEGHKYAIEQTLQNNLGTVNFNVAFAEAQAGESVNKAIAIELNTPIDLGRKEAPIKYYKFTATEAGDYALSVNMTGSVRVYGESEYNVQKDYANGTDFHNDVVTLAAGESLVFSVTPSADIEHISGGVQDFFIPNYYAVVFKADEIVEGVCIESPATAEENSENYVDTFNMWYGPVTVEAGKELCIIANIEATSNDCAALYLTNEKGQWYNLDTQITSTIDGAKQIYKLAASEESRIVYIMSSGLTAGGSWHYTFDDPNAVKLNYSIALAPSYTYDADKNAIVAKFTVPAVATGDDEAKTEKSLEDENITLYVDNVILDGTTTIAADIIDYPGHAKAGEEITISFTDKANALEYDKEYTLTLEASTLQNAYAVNVTEVKFTIPSPVIAVENQLTPAATDLDGTTVVITDVAAQKTITACHTSHPAGEQDAFSFALPEYNGDQYIYAKFAKVTNASVQGDNLYTIQMHNAKGESYNLWGSNGYLNFQTPGNTIVFVLGLASNYGQDGENCALWEVTYDAEKGYVLKNVGNGGYYNPAVAQPSAEPVYVSFYKNHINDAESAIVGISNVNNATKAAGIYNAAGAKISTLQKGLNIIVDENGTVKKIMK